MQRITHILLLTVTICGAALTAHAAEIGHFNGGVANIQTASSPEPGLYGVLYNYFYTTDRLNGPPWRCNHLRHPQSPRRAGGHFLGVEVDVDMYALVPVFMWVTDLESPSACP